ncbi:ATP-binding protein [Oscillatoria sp. FACHB-1406]|uniref:sensor histidine kinase n=1 Tax=Oscillatoria sp. FACHB-1406 TaxID=2692846 RepID=UPI001687ED64|nr:ATP-binding protein [Oscillatoria sp. FACHB-1406]MBD2577479.1 HAMP domain-containing protein [Oscillatoria sp. FACHB-1406]
MKKQSPEQPMSARYFLFSLRLTIPAILLFMGCIAGAFSYKHQVSLAHKQVEEDLTHHARLTATATAQLLEYIYRRTDLQNSQSESVTISIGRLSGDRNLSVALFCDERDLIRNASRYELQNQPLQKTLWADLVPVLKNVRTRRAGQIVTRPDRSSIQAIYPVVFPPQAGELRSRRVGAIILDYNLAKAKQRAIADASHQALQVVATQGFLCILVGFLLDRIVTQRARRLMLASNQLAQGNFDTRVHLQGADELTQMAQAFNYMAAQIQQNTEALQNSQQQLKAQTEELEQTLQELNQTQVQLIQQEKMSSLGQLVAGVAHEINNPVNFIHGNLNYVQEYCQDLCDLMQLYQQYYPSPIPEIEAKVEEIDLAFLQQDFPKILSSMKVGTSRIQQIVLSLRNFSRMDEAEFKAVDLHEGIESTLLILQHRLKAQPERPEICIIRNYGNLPTLECYSGQLNQVLMNILANAIDALEEKMRCQSCLLQSAIDALELQSPPSQQESSDCPYQITICTSVVDSEWIKIAIADNGLGIPEQFQNQIFNPFFTTKPVGKGTGLGLSISYQIITEKHRGKLECFSTPKVGTVFVIRLPIRQPDRAKIHS